MTTVSGVRLFILVAGEDDWQELAAMSQVIFTLAHEERKLIVDVQKVSAALEGIQAAATEWVAELWDFPALLGRFEECVPLPMHTPPTLKQAIQAPRPKPIHQPAAVMPHVRQPIRFRRYWWRS